MKKVHIIQGLGGLSISALGLYVFFRSVNTAVLWNEIRTTEIWIIPAVVLLNPLTIWFRSLRWKVLLPDKDNKQAKTKLFSITLIGFMVNNLLPARVGEAVRAVMLWKRNGYTVTESIGSLVFERGLDTLIFAAFFFIPVFFKKSLATLMPFAQLLAVVFLLAVIFIFLYSKFTRQVVFYAGKFLSFLPVSVKDKVKRVGNELISNLEWTHSWQKSVMVVIYSGLLMSCNSMMIYLLAWGVKSFDFIDSMFGVAMAALGAAIPLSPGYIGTLHSSLLQGLGMVGVIENRAGAIAVLYHAIGYITITALGIYSLSSMKMTFKEIRNAKNELNKK